jgi:type IV secretion system protein TrbJ
MEPTRALVLRLVSGILFLLCLSLISPRTAHAQFAGTVTVFDPAMFARQLQQLQQQTQAVLTEAQQLRNMVQNTTGGYGGVWQSNQSFLDELGSLIQQQGGLSYTLADLQAQFGQRFPGYAVPANPDQQKAKNAAVTLNTLNGTLAVAQGQARNFSNEQAQLAELEARNTTATGRMQAIQVGNEISLQEAQQVQMLRQLIVAMINAQNVAAANRINGQAAEDASVQRWLSAGPAVPFSSSMPDNGLTNFGAPANGGPQ